MKTVTWWLILGFNGSARLLKTKPSLAFNEVAYRLTIQIPSRKPSSDGNINLTLPQYSEPRFEVSTEATAMGWEE